MPNGQLDGGGSAGPASEPRRPSVAAQAFVLDGDAVTRVTDASAIAKAHLEGKRFLLEIGERSSEAERLLEDVLGIHPLTVEDVWNQVNIPKVEEFDDYVQLVMHGVREPDVTARRVRSSSSSST